MQDKRKFGLPPIDQPDSRILILGTFPSVLSRQRQQYYGHPQNQFWPIVFQSFGQPYTPHTAYSHKVQLLQDHRIALWDIVASCVVEGSADASIQQPVFNPVGQWLQQHTEVQSILFNGAASWKFWRSWVAIDMTHVILPSTSPANARYSFAHKLGCWQQALMAQQSQ